MERPRLERIDAISKLVTASRAGHAIRPAHRNDEVLAGGFVGKLFVEYVDGLHIVKVAHFIVTVKFRLIATSVAILLELTVCTEIINIVRWILEFTGLGNAATMPVSKIYGR